MLSLKIPVFIAKIDILSSKILPFPEIPDTYVFTGFPQQIRIEIKWKDWRTFCKWYNAANLSVKWGRERPLEFFNMRIHLLSVS